MFALENYKRDLIDVIVDNLTFLSIVITFRIIGEVSNIYLDRHDFVGSQTKLLALFELTLIIYVLIFNYKLIINFRHGFSGIKLAFQDIKNDYLNFKSLANMTIVIICIPSFLFSFTSIKTAIPYFNPFYLDKTLATIDYKLHLNNHPWEIINNFLNTDIITKNIEFLYHNIWSGVLLALLILTNIKFEYKYRKQFILSFVLTWIIIGSFFALILSSAGPCYYSYVETSESPYTNLMLYLNSIDNFNLISLQNGLWNIHSQGLPTYYTGISAMPSVHVASAAIFMFFGWKINRFIGSILTIFLILIQIGSIHLGWHYAVDGYTSIVLAFIIWKTVELILQKYGSQT